MRYFTPELDAASASDDPKRWAEADRESYKRSRAYHRQLEGLRGRVSRKAWQFFRYGFGRTGLHDANLIFFTAGDGLGYRANGKQPFRVNHQKAEVRIQFLNYDQDLLHTFKFQALSRIVCDLPTEPYSKMWLLRAIGMLTSYELRSLNKKFLRAEFLFASDGSILVDFKKLVYSRRKLKKIYADALKCE